MWDYKFELKCRTYILKVSALKVNVSTVSQQGSFVSEFTL
jgi:hypothetical protein